VRVVHDSHAVPLYHAVVSVTLLQGGVPAPTIDASLPALAARTGETLPQSTVIHHPGTTDYRPVITTKRPLLEMFARVAFNVATVGVLHSVVPIVRDEGTPARTEVRPPSDEDYARESPAAEALSRWLSTPACGEPGERCERWFLWPRSLASPLELAVVVHLRSYDPPALVYRLELQPGALEASLQQTFGDRIRPLAALARSSGAGLTVSWVLEYLSFEADSDRLTPASLRRLRRQLDGTRRHPGLRGRPELRFTVELGADAPQRERRAMRLREALRSGGVAAEQIELTETVGASVTLRVRHAVALE
ncbi:MAG: hypothetical protein KC636_22095, partial [Myxococcales bacterium]|nr:hypothetical protein [Myxococcales bacterium]